MRQSDRNTSRDGYSRGIAKFSGHSPGGRWVHVPEAIGKTPLSATVHRGPFGTWHPFITTPCRNMTPEPMYQDPGMESEAGRGALSCATDLHVCAPRSKITCRQPLMQPLWEFWPPKRTNCEIRLTARWKILEHRRGCGLNHFQDSVSRVQPAEGAPALMSAAPVHVEP